MKCCLCMIPLAWTGFKTVETLHATRASHPSHLSCSQELFQWNIIGVICRKWQKKSMKSNLGKFLRKFNVNFLQCKNWPIFANFEPFFPSNSILLIFGIEWMFPNCSQILVQEFRHQNFGIWIILGWVMAILVKNIGKITKLLCKGAKYLFFSQKLP